MNSYINQLKDSTPITSHRYFSDLLDGSMSFELFKSSQTNFYSAVCYFSRPMFLLCSRMENYADRLTILENILDEHGNGDIKESHAETYKSYLLNLGLKEKDINETLSHSAVSNFYSIIEDTIKGDSIETAIAMFGIIEDRYTEISATIATSLVNNNWLSEDQLTHYKTHKELDIYHAELFYKLVRPKWVEETSRENIIKGIKLGNAIIFDMFNNLLEED